MAIHELGHSLGLAHSPIDASIMFPYYKGPAESKDLNYDDIMAMYELYSKCLLAPGNLPLENLYFINVLSSSENPRGRSMVYSKCELSR